MAEKPAVLMIVIMRDGALLGSEALPPGTYHLGSAPGVDVQLDDPAVSPHHASVALRNGQVGVRDDGSATGLFLNGARVNLARVTSKDEIRIGPFTLKMRVLEQGIAAPRAPALQRPGSDPDETVVRSVPRELVEQTAQRGPEPAADPARVIPARTPGMLSPRPLPGRGEAAPRPPPAAHRTQPSARALAGAETGALDTTEPDVVPGPRGHLGPAVAPAASAGRPAPVPAPAPAAPALAASVSWSSVAAVRPPPEKSEAITGDPALRAVLRWGHALVQAQLLAAGEELRVGPSSRLSFPIHGWPLADGGVRLAWFEGGAWYVAVPEGVGIFGGDLPSGGRLKLAPGQAIGLHHGQLTLELRTVGRPPRVPIGLRPRADAGLLVPLAFCSVAMAAFLVFMPKRSELPDFTPQALPALRAILQRSVKKKEPPRSKLRRDAEKIVREKAARAETRPAAHAQAHHAAALPTPQAQAIASVAKILGRSAATRQLFAAVSKIGKGRGGGASFKASGLLGKVPLALNGSGGFTLGAGLGRGGGTRGAGSFRGLGGIGGLGALGRGGVGHRGVVGGVVSAPSRGGKISGQLPMEAVRKVVDQHIHEVQECYENGLIRTPGLSGKLVVEWVIGTDGSVRRVATKVATLQNPQVSDCIVSALKRWKFPRPSGGTVLVSYPFIFKSVGE